MLTLAKMQQILFEKDKEKQRQMIEELPEAEKEKLFAESEKLAKEGQKLVEKCCGE
jgi:hypothetical protein